VPLSDDQRREAVGLLSGVLLDAARKREGVPYGGGLDGAFDGASGGVVSLPDTGVWSRRAA
jgi:hypothetical protein